MTLQVQGKKTLLSGCEIGIAAIQRDRASVERTPAQKIANVEGQEHSDCAHFCAKRRAADGRIA